MKDDEYVDTFCLRCKIKTPNLDERVEQLQMSILKSKCKICDMNKSQFLKKETPESSSSSSQDEPAPVKKRLI